MVSVPRWLDEPRYGWIRCDVVAKVPPSRVAVGIDIDGQPRSMIVWEQDVRVPEHVPGAGELRIALVAQLPSGDPFGEGFLAELPSMPVDGTQRIRIRPEEAKVA